MASLLNMSGRALVTPPPYDAEIEYLQGNSSNIYIDTNFIPSIGDSIYCEYASTTLTYGDDIFKFISAGTGTYQIMFHYARNAGSYSRGFLCRYFSDTNSAIAVRPTTSTWYTLDISGVGKFTTINNSVTSTPISSLDGNDTTLKLVFHNVRHRAFKVYRNSELMLDFIPVRVGTTGYMYDKVSGQLFGNSGTGDFILGNDI